MQTLLNDIELDIQELKYLMQVVSADANPALRTVAKRNIQQMKARLDALQRLLDETSVSEQHVTEEFAAEQTMPEQPIAEQTVPETAEPVQVIVSPSSLPLSSTSSPSPILAERIKPVTDLRHAISLNDSFRFVRELFEGNAARMNAVVERLGGAASLDEAMEIYNSEVHADKENEAVADFVEFLRKYFS